MCVFCKTKCVLKLNFLANTENPISTQFEVLLRLYPLRVSTYNFFYVSTDNLSPTLPRASR